MSLVPCLGHTQRDGNAESIGHIFNLTNITSYLISFMWKVLSIHIPKINPKFPCCEEIKEVKDRPLRRSIAVSGRVSPTSRGFPFPSNLA